MNSVLNLGIIGVGGIGKVHARNVATKIPNAKLVAIADINIDVARKVAQEIGLKDIKIYSNYQELIQNSNIDGVIIATPTFTKKDIVIAAADAGKHVFVEKPLALNLRDVDEMIKHVERQRIKVVVGYQRRYDRAFIKAKEAVSQGKVGNILTIKSWTRDPPPMPQGWAADPRLSGGRLIDSLTHDFDIIRYLTGTEVVSVYAEGSVMVYEEYKKLGDYDHLFVILKMSNGILGLAEYSGYTPYGYDTGVEIHGSKGKVIISMGTNSSYMAISDNAYIYDIPTHWTERYEDAYVSELMDFVDSVINDREPKCTIYDGRAALEIALAAWESIRKGVPVKIPLG
ncbi:Gfo/Idh/MocA family oxidoreductase [Desulfurella sp.]|uniref:Gfo/Idh/MocA family oxidoreductase n=1 Tax=Desulfurella sp. TaxID=1962857 RepID=UPI0025B88D5F|nr:Gfo/Idh/MocA family oxidoreductase [Desulfurella sp.]